MEQIGEMGVWAWLLCALWAVCGGGMGWYCAVIARQITYVTLADGRRQERRLPMAFRLLLPLAPNLTRFFVTPGFDKTRADLSRKLVAAGFEGLLKAEEFLALRILVPAVLGLLWIVALRVFFSTLPEKVAIALLRLQMLYYLIGILSLYVYPAMWLKKALDRRHKSIQRALPFVVDLLTLSVEAGVDFMTAIQRTVERRILDPLGEELIRVVREIQIGKTRRDALRDMADRVDQVDLRSVINALVQADELGVSIGSTLRIQAGQIRAKRFDRAEKQANEAPVKMLFPLLAFIFPAVFLVLLGPMIMQMLRVGF